MIFNTQSSADHGRGSSIQCDYVVHLSWCFAFCPSLPLCPRCRRRIIVRHAPFPPSLFVLEPETCSPSHFASRSRSRAQSGCAKARRPQSGLTLCPPLSNVAAPDIQPRWSRLRRLPLYSTFCSFPADDHLISPAGTVTDPLGGCSTGIYSRNSRVQRRKADWQRAVTHNKRSPVPPRPQARLPAETTHHNTGARPPPPVFLRLRC